MDESWDGNWIGYNLRLSRFVINLKTCDDNPKKRKAESDINPKPLKITLDADAKQPAMFNFEEAFRLYHIVRKDFLSINGSCEGMDKLKHDKNKENTAKTVVTMIENLSVPPHPLFIYKILAYSAILPDREGSSEFRKRYFDQFRKTELILCHAGDKETTFFSLLEFVLKGCIETNGNNETLVLQDPNTILYQFIKRCIFLYDYNTMDLVYEGFDLETRNYHVNMFHVNSKNSTQKESKESLSRYKLSKRSDIIYEEKNSSDELLEITRILSFHDPNLFVISDIIWNVYHMMVLVKNGLSRDMLFLYRGKEGAEAYDEAIEYIRESSNCIRLTIDTAYESSRVMGKIATGKLRLAIDISLIIESYLYFHTLSDYDKVSVNKTEDCLLLE